MIEEDFGITKRDLYITLSRIKLGLREQFLADHFGLSQNQVSHIFTRTVPLLAAIMRVFVFMPDPDLIKANMPSAFRNNFASKYSSCTRTNRLATTCTVWFNVLCRFDLNEIKSKPRTKQEMSWFNPISILAHPNEPYCTVWFL